MRAALRRLRFEAQDLVSLGLRGPNPDPALAELAHELRAPADGDLLARIRRAAEAHLTTWLLSEQEGYDLALQHRLESVGQRIAREGGSVADYREALVHVGILFGAVGFATSPIAKTWYDGLLRQPHERGRTSTLRTPTGSALVPYGEFFSMDDEAVRPNHWALHALDGESVDAGGFVARTRWSGWIDRYEPPLGYGCRCHRVDVGAADAFRQGWSGDFPRGTGYLETRIVIDPRTGKRVLTTPGPDPTYHRLIIRPAA